MRPQRSPPRNSLPWMWSRRSPRSGPTTRSVTSSRIPITATNTGNQTLTGVTITDPGAGVVLGPCTPSIPATLAPTASVACVATHAVTQQDIDAGQYTNVAVGDSNETPADSDSETVPVSQTPALNVLKTETSVRPYQSVGQVVSYSITVTNTGNQTLTGVTVTDPGVGAVLGPCTPAIPATIAPGEAVVCTATHTVTQADLDAGEYSNTAHCGFRSDAVGQRCRERAAASEPGAGAGQVGNAEHLRRGGPGHHLHLQGDEHRQRDAPGAVLGDRRQIGDRRVSRQPRRSPRPRRSRARRATRSRRPTSTPARS